MTKISYVITLFNKQEYIRPVLDSVLNQTGDFEREIILVNDGSTDETLPLIEAYAREHESIKIITIENSGPAIATNTGIDAASGDFIKFVDGDDVLCPNSTELLLKALDDSEFGLAHSRIEQVDVNSDRYQYPQVNNAPYEITKNTDALNSMVEMARFNLSCVLVRTELAKKAGGCDNRFFIQDYSFSLRVSRLTNFVEVPVILAFAPKDSESRVSGFGAGAQVLHDLNMALGYLIHDYPDLPIRIRRKLVQRATSRAWRWAKRQEKKSMFSKEFINYVAAKLGFYFAAPAQRVFDSCDTFRRTSTIRLPKHIAV
jgi:glycosyltransferase involved in cell wall biosynthesis